MAPTYRTATQTRRGNRSGFPEHDDFEGLPVRQWRQEWVNVAPPPPAEITQQNDRWAIELPHGMPKDWQLLAPHSQELLRAARSGRLYKRPAPTEEDEADGEGIEKPEKKEEPAAAGFSVKVWKQIPRNIEGPAVSHLAKRHKHTVTLPSKAVTAAIGGATVTRATVRRIDAAGNPYDQTITLAEGQQVQGEIISTTLVPAPLAGNGGTTSQQHTPVKRRPPPPKRKAKGPGRGRKKGKLPLPPSTRPAQEGTDLPSTTDIKPETQDPDGTKVEDNNDDIVNQDSEMADNSVMQSDDEEGEEGEGDEGEEGEGERGESDDRGDDDGRDESSMMDTSTDQEQREDRDQEMEDAYAPEPTEPTTQKLEDEVVQQEDNPGTSFQPPSGDPLHLGPPPPLMLHKHEGSPLKNVVLPSPTGPSPMVSPTVQSSQPPDVNTLPGAGQETSQSGDAATETVATETAAAASSSTEGQPIDSGLDESSARGMSEPSDPQQPGGDVGSNLVDEPMLDMVKTEDADVPPEANISDVVSEIPSAAPLAVAPASGHKSPSPTPAPAPAAQETQPAETAETAEAAEAVEAAEEPEAHAPPPAEQEIASPVEQPTATTEAQASPAVNPEEPAPPTAPTAEGGDDGLDLLGGLERELDRQAAVSSEEATPAAAAIPTAESQAEPNPKMKDATENSPAPAAAIEGQASETGQGLDEQNGDDKAAE